MQDVNVTLFLYHLLQFLALHMHCTKNASTTLSAPKDGSITYGTYFFHLSLDLDKINLVLSDSYVVLNHNQFYLQYPISSPHPNGNANSISVVALL